MYWLQVLSAMVGLRKKKKKKELSSCRIREVFLEEMCFDVGLVEWLRSLRATEIRGKNILDEGKSINKGLG